MGHARDDIVSFCSKLAHSMALEYNRLAVGSKSGLEHSRLAEYSTLALEHSTLAVVHSKGLAGSRHPCGGYPLRHCWMT